MSGGSDVLSKKITIPLTLILIVAIVSSVVALSLPEPKDDIPPDKVNGLKAVDLREGRILLVWDAAKDNVKVDFYRVFRDSVMLEENPRVPMMVDSPGDVRIIHEYSVLAVDSSGNEGEPSDAVSVYSLPKDLVPPSKVTGLLVQSYENQLNLTWDEGWDNDKIAEYRIYRSGEPLGFQPSREYYLDLNLTPMVTCEYQVSAVDISGNEGPLSDPVDGYLPPGRVGQEALDFNLTDVYGRNFSLSDFRGKVVVLDLLRITCPPCIDQELELVTVFNDYSPEDLRMISVGVSPDTDPQDLILFKESYADDWIFAVDTDNVSKKYSVKVVPTEVIIDRSGTIVFVHLGVVSAEALEDVIDPLI